MALTLLNTPLSNKYLLCPDAALGASLAMTAVNKGDVVLRGLRHQTNAFSYSFEIMIVSAPKKYEGSKRRT